MCENKPMLDKKDLHEIEQLFDRKLKDAFSDFFDSFFAPFVKRNEGEHKQILHKLEGKIDEIGEHIKDHQKRIIRLETIVHP